MQFNQQQFSKYLSGRARPSASSLRRISRHFGVSDEDLFQETTTFVSWYRERRQINKQHRRDPLADVFPGNKRAITPFLGAYQVFYRSPSAPDQIIIGAAFLDEVDGTIYSRSLEAPFVQVEGRRQWSRGNGKVAYHGDRLFIVDVERGNEGALTTTILVPPHRYRQDYLYGTMMFLASYPRRHPTTSFTVWKRARSNLSAKALLAGCKTEPVHSTKIDPRVKKYLLDGSSNAPPMDNQS